MYNVSEAYSEAVAKQSRCWRLGGNITLASRTEIALTDRNVMDMQIESQMTNGNASEDSIELGSVYASMLTMQIHDGSGADSFADAMIQPFVGLQLSDGSYEDIPMGIFYVNAASIKRVKDIVTFCAYDKMIFLQYLLTPAMRTTMSGFSVYTASAYLCAMVGLQLAQEQSDVESFPNSDIPLSVSDERIETARDVIMWCAQMMGCYARIDRFGRLEYVQIKAENDEATGMIIPVREIKANQRFETKFADGVLRITSLTMKKNDGKYARAHITMTAENKRSMELELDRNPLLTEQSIRDVGEALKAILKVIKTAYFRPFKAEISSDPALDAGDYVRLRGGNIDTSRGYATGMITHNVWRYRGHHDIVNVGAVPVISQLDSSAVLAELSDTDELSESAEDDISGDVDGEEIVYVQPRAQNDRGGTGTSIGQAVIIQKNDLTKFLEKYEVIGYIHGNRVVHTAGAGGIVCGGYLWHGLLDTNDPALDYSKIVTPSGDVYDMVLDYVTYSTTQGKYDYRYMRTLNGEKTHSLTNSYGDTALALKWDKIYPPSDTHPHGYVSGYMTYYYTTSDGTIRVSSSHLGTLTMDFLSAAEYNAAIGLTYDYEVNEDNLVDAGDGV